MNEAYMLIHQFVKQYGIKDILYFIPIGIPKFEYRRPSLGELLQCMKNDDFEGEFFDTFHQHHTDLEVMNIAEGMHLTSLVIINNGENDYKAIINIKLLEEEINALMEDNNLPVWKKQLRVNGIKPIYDLYLLETMAFLDLYKIKNYHNYQIIPPEDYIYIGGKVMKEYIRAGGEFKEMIHVFNYVINQFLLKFKDLKAIEKSLFEEKISSHMKEILVKENIS